MAKRAKKPARRPRQQPLPETETIGDRVLDEIGEELADVEESRLHSTKIEVDCRRRAKARMERIIADAVKKGTDCPYTLNQDGAYTYKRGGLTLILEPGESRIKVRLIKQDIHAQPIVATEPEPTPAEVESLNVADF